MREAEKPDNINKEHEQRKHNKSSTKQVELSHLKEEIKYIKRTLDILLERQWLETPKDNEEGFTETKKIRKSNRNKSKNTETKEEQSINSNKEQEQKQEKDKGDKKEILKFKI